MEILSGVGMIAALVLFVVLRLRVFLKPVKAILKFVLNAVLGYAMLWIASFLGDFIGLNIEVNLLNTVIAVVLGVPGVLLLALYQFLFR